MTQRQIDVLRWIGDGCPEGVMVEQGFPERITAGALRNQGLVTTKGRGPTWSAAITSSGKEYLARVDVNRTYVLTPIRSPQAAHAKLILLLGADRGLMAVDPDGSVAPDQAVLVMRELRGLLDEDRRDYIRLEHPSSDVVAFADYVTGTYIHADRTSDHVVNLDRSEPTAPPWRHGIDALVELAR